MNALLEQANRIKQKLNLAQKADRNLEVFGADSHRYQLHQPASYEKIEALEQEYNISLPECFRTFLLHIGNGGKSYESSAAGPYYGIYPIGENMNDLIEGDVRSNLADQCKIYPDMPDEYWKELISEYEEGPEWKEEETNTDAAYNKIFSGVLPIGSQGCTYLHGLILNGPHRGVVVNLDMGLQKPFFTYEKNFLDWYERWLDEIIDRNLIGDKVTSFGYHPGGSEISLLERFDNSTTPELKTEYLLGLQTKRIISAQCFQELAERLNNADIEHQKLMISCLAKSDFDRAIPFLTAFAEKDLLTVYQSIHFYGPDNCASWSDLIRKNMHRIEDDETLRFCCYVLGKTRTDYGDWLIAFTESDNVQIRQTAIYNLSSLNQGRRFENIFIRALYDSSPHVVRYGLNGLSGNNNIELLEHYNQVQERFSGKEDTEYVLSNLQQNLQMMKMDTKNDPVSVSVFPPGKKKWYEFWK